MSRMFPEIIDDNLFPEDTTLGDYKVWDLSVDKCGNVLEGPQLTTTKGDNFVITHGKHELDCLFKTLPIGILRSLSARTRFEDTESGITVVRPRYGRDDLAIYQSGKTSRKNCFYGASYLTGMDSPSEQDIHDFIADLRRFVDVRPNVGAVAKLLMYKYVNEDLVRHKKIPQEVLRLFNEHGRGCNMDSSVIGTSGVEIKADQRMSYLSAMSKLRSPTEHIFNGVFWENDSKYNPEDSYGIYCVSGNIKETLQDTPLYMDCNGTYIPIVGKFEDVVVLKPTMDDLKLLERLGDAKIDSIKWSWRFKGRTRQPYMKLYTYMNAIKSYAGASSAFWKLVACALWGLTLHKRIDVAGGRPITKGGCWFNPVIGYTTTDLVRSYNFRAKLKAEGKISAEVVDMIMGPVGDTVWADPTVYKTKGGPYLYTHLGPLFHVSPADDKLGILEDLRASRGQVVTRRVSTRRTFDIMRYHPSSSQVKEFFGEVRHTDVRIHKSVDKRVFPREASRVPMKELLNSHYRGMPATMERLSKMDPVVDWNAMLYELSTGTLLDKLLRGGKTW